MNQTLKHLVLLGLAIWVVYIVAQRIGPSQTVRDLRKINTPVEERLKAL